MVCVLIFKFGTGGVGKFNVLFGDYSVCVLKARDVSTLPLDIDEETQDRAITFLDVGRIVHTNPIRLRRQLNRGMLVSKSPLICIRYAIGNGKWVFSRVQMVE
ncbi:hypothetical protein C5167_023824 [Papaver somniferum]|uniref:Uncharacterized protein n=1 Tax=Papaver somniferum TaxID=3469 RepID=A0A4Y7JQG8_PAPSO|nr:hypothetical protein C5167_023824 [Papaver somniferum]